MRVGIRISQEFLEDFFRWPFRSVTSARWDHDLRALVIEGESFADEPVHWYTEKELVFGRR